MAFWQEPGRVRNLVVALVLLVISLLLLFTDVHHLLFSYMAVVLEPWRAERVAAATRTIDAREVSVQERLCRLNAIGVDLRRRLDEYEEVYGHRDIFAPRRPIRARILARHARDARHYLEIDRGAVDGVRRDAPVLVGWSLIGLVAGERAHQSPVQLLTDLESAVPVAIFTPSTFDAEAPDGEDAVELGRWVADGVVRGTGDPRLLRVRRIEDRDGLVIEPGMQVLTNGLANRLPPGLVVGTVERVIPPDADGSPSDETAAMRTGHGAWQVEVGPLRPWGTYHSVLVLAEAPPADARR